MTGRTVYFPKDAAWWRRSRVVELGQAHGAAGPAVLDYLTCEARSQGPLRNHDGSVKSGYAAIAHSCFIAAPGDVKAIVATAVEVGLLDDFEEQGRTFTCRISGWHEDIERPLAASRKARQRETTGDGGATSGDTTPTVPMPTPNVARCPPMSPIVTRDVDGDVEGERESPAVSLSSERANNGQSLSVHIAGVLQRGIDSIPTDERMKRPSPSAIAAALAKHPVSDDLALAVAIDTRGAVQALGRAPNVAGLYAQKLEAARAAA